jgi:uncharacterized protein (DUF1501 family)
MSDQSCHCNGFTRAKLLRDAAARAGEGLPTIEPGMPLPAGTGLSRRRFVFGAGALAMAVYGANRLLPGVFEEGIARAAAADPQGRVLVSVFLPGGIDSLTLLAPTGDPNYKKLRPKLALPAGQGFPFREDSRLVWHPQAEALAVLHNEGKLAVMPALGYEGPDQSHFTSRHYYEVGATDAQLRIGWLGRYLDAVGTGDNPLQGLSLNGALSPTLAPGRVPVAALDSPAAYRFAAQGVDDPVLSPMLEAIGGLGGLPTPGSEPDLAQARLIAGASSRLVGQLRPLASPSDGAPSYGTPVPYPPTSDLGGRLQAIAAMIGLGLPLKIVTADAEGLDFDTHAEQAQNLPQRIADVGGSLLAFQRDLEARGLADRVLTLVWSEFGRRPEENGSGTDHGAAGLGFVLGAQSSGGMIGEFPGLATLDEGDNLRMTSDFRGVYAGLLEQWLGADASSVIPDAARFARPKLVR